MSDQPEEFDEELTLEEFAKQIGSDWSDESLADRGSAPELISAGVTINWRTVEGEKRTEAARELADWVTGWLVPRYNIESRDIPDCWWQHGDLVEELSALHSAWQVAFDAADSGYGPIGWQERFALARTRDAFKERCKREHVPDEPRTMPKAPDTF